MLGVYVVDLGILYPRNSWEKKKKTDQRLSVLRHFTCDLEEVRCAERSPSPHNGAVAKRLQRFQRHTSVI